MTIVLDTNVLIAAFMGPEGICRDILTYVCEHHQLTLSDHILTEFRRILVEKLTFEEELAEQHVAFLLDMAALVVPARFEQAVCRDPDDDWVLGTAISGQASWLVTGDKDLLELAGRLPFRIGTPREFVLACGGTLR